jgi:hypothetical protein
VAIGVARRPDQNRTGNESGALVGGIPCLRPGAYGGDPSRFRLHSQYRAPGRLTLPTPGLGRSPPSSYRMALCHLLATGACRSPGGCAATSRRCGNRDGYMRLAAAESSPTGAHRRGGGCPALALLLSYEGMVPRAGVEPAALRLRVACCIQMSFHGIVVPPARICTCVLRLKRPLLSCLSFGGVVLVPPARFALARASRPTGV